MEWISNKLDIKKLGTSFLYVLIGTEEWYNVTDSQLNILGVRYVSIKHGGLINLLKKVYPGSLVWRYNLICRFSVG